jgi:hypothetical protein
MKSTCSELFKEPTRAITMKYKVEEKDNGINIEVSESSGKQDKLLESFQECQEGRCTCPTQEYSKLESLEIEKDEDTIRLRLKSKPGSEFDKAEINKCLEYTKNRITSER